MVSASKREAATGRAEVLNEAVRTFLHRVARVDVVRDRGKERAAVVRNIMADMVGEEGLGSKLQDSHRPTRASWNRAGFVVYKEWRGVKSGGGGEFEVEDSEY